MEGECDEIVSRGLVEGEGRNRPTPSRTANEGLQALALATGFEDVTPVSAAPPEIRA
jgi:hypothetical protein